MARCHGLLTFAPADAPEDDEPLEPVLCQEALGIRQNLPGKIEQGTRGVRLSFLYRDLELAIAGASQPPQRPTALVEPLQYLPAEADELRSVVHPHRVFVCLCPSIEPAEHVAGQGNASLPNVALWGGTQQIVADYGYSGMQATPPMIRISSASAGYHCGSLHYKMNSVSALYTYGPIIGGSIHDLKLI
jgi:hypothetical protein